jgi:hypothetical protein
MTKVPQTIDEIRDALSHVASREGIYELVHEWLHPPPPDGSTRVRIAVVFDENDEWAAHGESETTDDDSGIEAGDFLVGAIVRIVFVEADIPPPVEEPTVVGRVVP